MIVFILSALIHHWIFRSPSLTGLFSISSHRFWCTLFDTINTTHHERKRRRHIEQPEKKYTLQNISKRKRRRWWEVVVAKPRIWLWKRLHYLLLIGCFVSDTFLVSCKIPFLKNGQGEFQTILSVKRYVCIYKYAMVWFFIVHTLSRCVLCRKYPFNAYISRIDCNVKGFAERCILTLLFTHTRTKVKGNHNFLHFHVFPMAMIYVYQVSLLLFFLQQKRENLKSFYCCSFVWD